MSLHRSSVPRRVPVLLLICILSNVLAEDMNQQYDEAQGQGQNYNAYYDQQTEDFVFARNYWSAGCSGSSYGLSLEDIQVDCGYGWCFFDKPMFITGNLTSSKKLPTYVQVVPRICDYYSCTDILLDSAYVNLCDNVAGCNNAGDHSFHVQFTIPNDTVYDDYTQDPYYQEYKYEEQREEGDEDGENQNQNANNYYYNYNNRKLGQSIPKFQLQVSFRPVSTYSLWKALLGFQANSNSDNQYSYEYEDARMRSKYQFMYESGYRYGNNQGSYEWTRYNEDQEEENQQQQQEGAEEGEEYEYEMSDQEKAAQAQYEAQLAYEQGYRNYRYQQNNQKDSEAYDKYGNTYDKYGQQDGYDGYSNYNNYRDQSQYQYGNKNGYQNYRNENRYYSQQYPWQDQQMDDMYAYQNNNDDAGGDDYIETTNSWKSIFQSSPTGHISCFVEFGLPNRSQGLNLGAYQPQAYSSWKKINRKWYSFGSSIQATAAIVSLVGLGAHLYYNKKRCVCTCGELSDIDEDDGTGDIENSEQPAPSAATDFVPFPSYVVDQSRGSDRDFGDLTVVSSKAATEDTKPTVQDDSKRRVSLIELPDRLPMTIIAGVNQHQQQTVQRDVLPERLPISVIAVDEQQQPQLEVDVVRLAPTFKWCFVKNSVMDSE